MPASETIQIRIDRDTKTQVTKILEELSINMSEAIKIYLRQIVLHKGIPFEISLPSRKALKTMAEVDAGKRLHEAADSNELLKNLRIKQKLLPNKRRSP